MITIKFYIDYDFPNWNKYINVERANRYAAASLKKKELDIIRYYTVGKRYTGQYPVKMTFTKYFIDKRQDLDNTRLKGIIDGLVKCGVIENDNLTKIRKIVIKAEFDKNKNGIEVLIEPYEEEI